MKIQVFPIQIANTSRIGIKPLGFDKAFPVMMKQVPGSRWTPDSRCWHIPYEKSAYATLKRIFGAGQIISSPNPPNSRHATTSALGMK